MEKTKSQNNKKFYIILVAVLLAIIVIVIVLWNAIFVSSDTYTSDGGQKEPIGSILCKSNNPKDPFFESEKAVTNSYEIKMTYAGSSVGKASFSYVGTFGSEREARDEISRLRGKQGTYLQERGMTEEDLYPGFTIVDNTGRINLYFDDETLISVVAPLLFLDSNEMSGLKGYSVSDIQKIYKVKGFSCSFQE